MCTHCFLLERYDLIQDNTLRFIPIQVHLYKKITWYIVKGLNHINVCNIRKYRIFFRNYDISIELQKL